MLRTDPFTTFSGSAIAAWAFVIRVEGFSKSANAGHATARRRAAIITPQIRVPAVAESAKCTPRACPDREPKGIDGVYRRIEHITVWLGHVTGSLQSRANSPEAVLMDGISVDPHFVTADV